MEIISDLLEVIPPEDLFRHLVVFGATGCGKTRHVILPLLARVLARDANDPEKRAGALIFDVKGDMAEHVGKVMKAAGRTDEVITLGRNGNAWFDPFDGHAHDSRFVAEQVIEIVRGLHPNCSGGSYDDFWIENNRRLLQMAAVIARAHGAGVMGGLKGLSKAVSLLCSIRSLDEDDEQINSTMECLSIAEQLKLVPLSEIKMARDYLKTDAHTLADNTWSVVVNYAKTYISCLTDSKLAEVLSPSHPHQFLPEEVIDQGRVVLVSLSRIHYGPAAEVYRNLIKTAFQSCALQRYHRQYFDGTTLRPINATRPVYFVADEFPALVTSGSKDDGDAFFLDKCREVKVGCILSAQGVSALTARMQSDARAAHLLNNCCTKVFLSTDCAETLRYFESTVPVNPKETEEVVFQRASAPPAFRLPNYEFAPPTLWVPKSKSMIRPEKGKFPASTLRLLKTGEAIVIRPQGFAERMCFPAFKPTAV